MWVAVVAMVTIVSDLWTKRLVQDALTEVHRIDVFSFLAFVDVRNPGVAFGFFGSLSDDGAVFAMSAAIAVLAAIFLKMAIEFAVRCCPLEAVSLAAIFGGAVGNLANRITDGHVFDFILLHVGSSSFYVFNIADSAITVGVAVILMLEVLGMWKRRQTSQVTKS